MYNLVYFSKMTHNQQKYPTVNRSLWIINQYMLNLLCSSGANWRRGYGPTLDQIVANGLLLYGAMPLREDMLPYL